MKADKGEVGDEEYRTDIAKADAAINSNNFWAFAVMIDSIAEVMEIIMSWGESCALFGTTNVVSAITPSAPLRVGRHACC